MQVDSILNQTTKADCILAWRNYHEDSSTLSLSNIHGLDRWIDSNFNWKFYGRFAAALLADTEYVAMFDDDTIPGMEWFDNCLNTMKTHEGILGSAGVTLHSGIYIEHTRSGWPSLNEQPERVDLVGHAWFFKRKWLSYLWAEKPFTWDNGEDIQFSYLAQKYGGIQTFTPPHPANNREMHGSLFPYELGADEKASSCIPDPEYRKKFTIDRDLCVQNALANGWQTVRGVKL